MANLPKELFVEFQDHLNSEQELREVSIKDFFHQTKKNAEKFMFYIHKRN